MLTSDIMRVMLKTQVFPLKQYLLRIFEQEEQVVNFRLSWEQQHKFLNYVISPNSYKLVSIITAVM